jgi:hypothetical protein
MMIDDRGHAVVGRDRQEVRLELFTLGNIHRDHGVWEAALLEHDRNLPAVGRWPEIKIDRRIAARPLDFLAGFGGPSGARPGLAAGAGVLPDRFVGDTSHSRLLKDGGMEDPVGLRGKNRNQRRRPCMEKPFCPQAGGRLHRNKNSQAWCER